MTAVYFARPDVHRAQPARAPSAPIRVALLGLGHVGSAIARLTKARRPVGADIEIVAALVRDTHRIRAVRDIAVTTDPEAVFAARPTIVVEALGGVDAARTLVLEAIARGLPVVTANKSLLAHYGDEIAEAAAIAGVPLRYEASVIAGVPFLGTFARRPYASAISSIAGIVNGTTNYILSQMKDGTTAYDSALSDAQRRGFAEPDPAKDIEGIDAVEKLVILIRLLGGRRVAPASIETAGIGSITPADLRLAQALGGTLKPVVQAEGLSWPAAGLAACVGPAFVPARHPLASVDHVSNGVCLRDVAGSRLCFTGPGAGPDVTAVTMLDDVLDASTARVAEPWAPAATVTHTVAPGTAWFLRVTSATLLPSGAGISDLLSLHGVWVERCTGRDTLEGHESLALLTHPCSRSQVERAAAAVAAATGSTVHALRALEPQP
jgi:homoserine dehydrogenase